MDPTKIGDVLGQAQDVQQVLGVIIGALILGLVFVVKLWVADRKKHAADLKALEVRGAEKFGAFKTTIATKKGEQEKERANHHEAMQSLHAGHTNKVEGLMREMLDLSVGFEKALDQLHRRARPSESGHIGGQQ